MMKTRTSNTHPLRVDWLPEGLADMPGRLGMTFGPGKCGPSAFGGRWERELGADLDRLKEHYQADCLVTLLEESELKKLEMEALFEEARARSLDVYWWKWPDATAPEDAHAMEALVDHLLCRVYNGERVVVHCRGGLGRTGTVVGCCLRALQYTPEEAIAMVRMVRPGAIETRAQERFVREYDYRWVSAGATRCPRMVSQRVLSTRAEDEPRILHLEVRPGEMGKLRAHS